MKKLLLALMLAISMAPMSYAAQLQDTIIDNDLTINTSGTIIMEGSSDDANDLTLTLVNPSAARTITFPNATGTVALTSQADGTIDHGADLSGLGDDDHTQYLLADGTRALAGAWDMASQATTNVNIDSGVITGITDLLVADGGTGVSTLTDGGIVLGSGAGAVTVLAQATNGQLPIGSTGADPVLAAITGGTNLTITNGAGSITADVDDAFLVNDSDDTTTGSITMVNANASGTVSGSVVAWEGGTFDTLFVAGTPSEDVQYRWPLADGTSGQLLSTNGGGTLTWEDDAGGTDTNSVKTYWLPFVATLPLEAADSVPPIAKDAGTNIDQLVVDFNDTTDECRTVTLFIPPDIDTSATVTFTLPWYSAAATTNDALWDVRHNGGVAEGADPDASLTTEAAAADTTQGTAGQLTFTTWTETVSNLGWAASEVMDAVVCRDADSTNPGTDNLVGDARAKGIAIGIPRT